MKYPVTKAEVIKVDAGEEHATPDLLVTEEPLEIRLGYGPSDAREQVSVAVTMRTPGNDAELALGFLFTEDIIGSKDDFTHAGHCRHVKADEAGNVFRVELREDIQPDLDRLKRNFYAASSCGVCGKASMDAIKNQHCTLIPEGFILKKEILFSMDSQVMASQAMFRHTGGIHAAALFDGTGKMLCLREDIGRHNAVDKVIGHMLMQGDMPLSECVLWISGRAGFEIIQKAVAAGIPVVAALGAASSLAAATAAEFNQTLIGFLRANSANIYTAPFRVS